MQSEMTAQKNHGAMIGRTHFLEKKNGRFHALFLGKTMYVLDLIDPI